MDDPAKVSRAFVTVLREKLGDVVDHYRIPPPAFIAMQGEVLTWDLDAGLLTARFPVLEQHLNPFGVMQGGMIAAAVDNTLGPLSMLVAPPNVTRRLEMKYSRVIRSDHGYITVAGQFVERKKRRLFFTASVRDPDGAEAATAQAVHWIVDSG